MLSKENLGLIFSTSSACAAQDGGQGKACRHIPDVFEKLAGLAKPVGQVAGADGCLGQVFRDKILIGVVIVHGAWLSFPDRQGILVPPLEHDGLESPVNYY